MSRENLLFLPNMDLYTETDGFYHQDANLSTQMGPTVEELFMLNIEEHMCRLTNRQADMVRLFLAGKSYRQAAKVLGISPYACYRHMQAAIKRLKVVAKELK